MAVFCGDCVFWHPHFEGNSNVEGADPEVGQCMRYPPTAAIDLEGLQVTIWPHTEVDDYCGEGREQAKDDK